MRATLKTLYDLRNALNELTTEELQQPIIFGLVDDSLEDSWEITGARKITRRDMVAPERFAEFIKPGQIIFYP